MSKKYFESAALFISREPDRQIAIRMAALVIFMNDNPRFDEARFLTACGL